MELLTLYFLFRDLLANQAWQDEMGKMVPRYVKRQTFLTENRKVSGQYHVKRNEMDEVMKEFSVD